MPIGKDLGFSYLVLVVLVVVPVIALLVRRKWRLWVARSEEIKRLLVLASEEDARAEVEASAYFAEVNLVSRPLQCQCAVCFCPTTTRCARCKAVRYCSTKCQIIHWRQGHKEQCHSFTASYHIDEVGDGSNEKTPKQDDNEIHGKYSETGGWKCAKLVQDTHEEPLHAESNCPPGTFCGNDEGKFECRTVGKGINSSSPETERLTVHQSTTTFSDRLETNCFNNVDLHEQTSLECTSVNSVNFSTSLHMLHQIENNNTDNNIQYGQKSSSGCGADMTTKSSLSVPSPSSGFWECAVKPSRPNIDALDPAQLHSSGADGGRKYNSQSSNGFHVSPQFLSPEMSNHVVNGTTTVLHPVESGKGKYLSFSASGAPFSSSTRRRSLEGTKPVEDNRAGTVAAGTSEFAARNGLKTSTQKVDDHLRSSKFSRHSQLRIGSEIARRYSNKGLFPYDLFVKLYNCNRLEVRPCGLTNCGNSCYANAVLQCLVFTPPLTAYLLQRLHSKTCERKEWCFTCELEHLVLKTKEGNSPLSPIGILSEIRSIGSHLSNGRQEDAHEFLRYAIDTMQTICLKEAGVNASGYLAEETTLIGLIFGGYLRSKVKCMKCRGKSEQHERMMDLTIEIEGDVGTLEEALQLFTSTEILDGENRYHCNRCKSYQKAKKTFTVLEAPNILTIALKRFQSGKYGKLNKSIQFPEILNLAPYMSGTSDKSPIYRLYGVVVHLDIGNAAYSGHYVCYVNVQRNWFKIDDSVVKAVELECVLAENAYLLLYTRCSPRAPRLIRKSTPPRDPRTKNNSFMPRSNPKCLYPHHSSFQPAWPISEEDSSSDNSSSIFSEGCSCSTESSTRDSTSTDGYDQFLGDLGHYWNYPWRDLSDSELSSSSPSPETGGFRNQDTECEMDNPGLWAKPLSRRSNSVSMGRVPLSYSDTTKPFRTLFNSRSYRETNSDRLGWFNFLRSKKSGTLSRRTMRGRSD